MRIGNKLHSVQSLYWDSWVERTLACSGSQAVDLAPHVFLMICCL